MRTPAGEVRERAIDHALPLRGALSAVGVRREIERVWAQAGHETEDLDERRRRFAELIEKMIARGQPRRTDYRRAAARIALGNILIMEEACERTE